MRELAAYLLAVIGGNEKPDAAAVTKILDSVGIKPDQEALDRVISQLEGKDIDELITQGKEKLATIGGGVGGGAAASTGGAAAGGAAAEEAAAPEPESESDSDDEVSVSLLLYCSSHVVNDRGVGDGWREEGI